MKHHKKITSTREPIYCEFKAKRLYKIKKHSAHQLSVMKQENIRIAISNKTDVTTLMHALCKNCGYCFKTSPNNACSSCVLFHRIGKACYDSVHMPHSTQDLNLKAFSAKHKAWCKQLGLWQKGWR